MLERIFDPIGLLIIVGCGVAAAIIGAIVAGTRGENAGTLALEAGLHAAAGAFVARTFIAIVLNVGGDTREAGIAIGWAFFLWPGAIDTVAAPFGAQLLTTPDRLLLIATAVGALGGLFDGIWQVRAWPWPSALTFIVDYSWGLAANTNGVLVHLLNTFIDGHASDGRTDVHRYTGGFHVKSGYAFTQGLVMSTLPDAPGTSLYIHERTHVRQNRIFGPLFTLSYVAWAVIMFVPAAIAAAARSAGFGETVEAWSYYNNPWETWAYKVGENNGAGPRTDFGTHVWSDGLVIGVSVPFFAVVAIVAFLTVSTVWL